MDVLLFSRGWGRGHAIPDMAIVDELSRRRDDFSVRFASYATGADTYQEFGHEVVDLGLPARSPPLEAQLRATQVIGKIAPDLVIAHEEYGAMPGAKVFGIPTIFVTDFFAGSEKFSMQALEYADEIIFTGREGVFDEPVQVRGRVNYVGPVFRPFQYSKLDRSRAREELGLHQHALVISVMPGSWTEQQAPMFRLVTSAVEKLDADNQSLIWIAGQDYDDLHTQASESRYVSVARMGPCIDRLMVASDLVITKANRLTCLELSMLAVPSISISYGLNPPDDKVVSTIESNTHLTASETDAESLANTISQVLASAVKHPPCAHSPKTNGRIGAAQHISNFIDRIKKEQSSQSA